MLEFIDPASPRYQNPFEELPRGFVPWPKEVLDRLERAQEMKGFRFAEEYVRKHLERETLAYYYEGWHVAYRPAAGGVEVLAVGWDDAAAYLNDPAVKIAHA